MRVYRKNHNLTQAQLGEKIGKVPRQIISNMERGNRTISLATAKKLAAILNVPATRFLDLWLGKLLRPRFLSQDPMFQQFLQISPAVQNAMNKYVIIENMINNSVYFNVNSRYS